MKEIEPAGNNRPKIPDAFTKAFPGDFETPTPATEIDQIVGEINRGFIIKLLRRRDAIEKMCG